MLRFSLRVLPKFMPLKPFLIEFRQNTKKNDEQTNING